MTPTSLPNKTVFMFLFSYFCVYSVDGQSSGSCDYTAVTNCLSKWNANGINSGNTDAYCQAGKEVTSCLSQWKDACADDAILSSITAFENTWKTAESTYCSGGSNGSNGSNSASSLTVILIGVLSTIAYAMH